MIDKKRIGRPKLPDELKKKYIGRITIYIEDPAHLQQWRNKVKHYRNGEECLTELIKHDEIFRQSQEL